MNILKLILIGALSATTSTFAHMESDISLSIGNESFDDTTYLKDNKISYGIKNTHYSYDNLGYEFAYERTNEANNNFANDSINLSRLYANALLYTDRYGRYRPYILAGGGYEFSSERDFVDDQAFAQVGLGLKYRFSTRISVFLETRVLKRLDSNSDGSISTLGLSYAFEDLHEHIIAPCDSAIEKKVYASPNTISVSQPHVISYEESYADAAVHEEENSIEHFCGGIKTSRCSCEKKVEEKTYARKNGKYYIQLAAYTHAKTAPLLKRINALGFTNASVKQRRGLNLVVVGPYEKQRGAKEQLSTLRRLSKCAFIIKL